MNPYNDINTVIRHLETQTPSESADDFRKALLDFFTVRRDYWEQKNHRPATVEKNYPQTLRMVRGYLKFMNGGQS